MLLLSKKKGENIFYFQQHIIILSNNVSRTWNIFFIDIQNRWSEKNAGSWSQDIHNNWWKTGSLNIQQFIMSWWCIGNFTINYELSINWFFILCSSMILLFLSPRTHSIPALNYDKNKPAWFLPETECWTVEFLMIFWPDRYSLIRSDNCSS